MDSSTPAVAQPVRRIPFSRPDKLVEKLKELKALDVIEKVKTPTSLVNPLVTVAKPNGDVTIWLNMRRANETILRKNHLRIKMSSHTVYQKMLDL